MNQDLTTKGAKEVAARGNGEATRSAPIFMPDVDILETDTHFTVLANMPGVAPDAVDVTLERRLLTLRGRVRSREHGGYRRQYTEYAEGDYERSFALSEDIDREKIEAVHKNGVLTVKLPKAETAKSRRIDVKGN